MTRPLKILPSLAQFAKDIFANVVANYSGNVMLSPVAIQTSLALLRMAAGSQTETILQNHLYFANMSLSSTANQFHTLLQAIQNSPIIKMANAIFVDPHYKIHPYYQVIANDLFYSSVLPCDFSDAFQSANTINNWISGETNYNIMDLVSPEYMDKIRRTATMFLANAMYFNGRWAHQFDQSKTTNTTFYTGSCVAENAEAMPMMETKVNHFFL